MANICPSCGFESQIANSKDANPIFCLRCGEIIGGENYQNQALIKEYSSKIKLFLSNLEDKTKEICASFALLLRCNAGFIQNDLCQI